MPNNKGRDVAGLVDLVLIPFLPSSLSFLLISRCSVLNIISPSEKLESPTSVTITDLIILSFSLLSSFLFTRSAARKSESPESSISTYIIFIYSNVLISMRWGFGVLGYYRTCSDRREQQQRASRSS